MPIAVSTACWAACMGKARRHRNRSAPMPRSAPEARDPRAGADGLYKRASGDSLFREGGVCRCRACRPDATFDLVSDARQVRDTASTGAFGLHPRLSELLRQSVIPTNSTE